MSIVSWSNPFIQIFVVCKIKLDFLINLNNSTENPIIIITQEVSSKYRENSFVKHCNAI